MDNNDNNNDLGKKIRDIEKQKIKIVWKMLPISVKVQIIAGISIFVIVFLFLLTILSMNPVNHLFFNDKASSDNYNMDAAYNEFIETPCVEGNKKCSDRQEELYKYLKEDEQRFIKKLDKLSSKYSLENRQKYIILTTIFYGNDENYFYKKGSNDASFTIKSGAYVLDDDDEVAGDEDETLITDASGYQQVDTLKELAKQFKVYPVYCTYNTTENGKTVEKSDPLTYENAPFGFGFWEKILNKTTDTGFEEASNDCKKKDNGHVTSSFNATTTGEASEAKYYKYLEESTYLDSKEVYQTNFFKPYYQTHELKEWTDKDLKAVRKIIIIQIQKIVEEKLALDQKMNLNNACAALAGNSVDYWWPLADSESGGFAAGESSAKSGSGYGWRIHPIKKTKKFHAGVDIPTPRNTYVIAAKSGTVTIVKGGCKEGNMGCNGGAGNYISIQHPDGAITRYLHLNSFKVNVGDTVQQGQVIALSGSTGGSTGPHLHFEIRPDGTNTVNPLDHISSSNQRPGGSVSASSLSSGGTVNPTLTRNTLNETKVSFLEGSPIRVVQLENEVDSSTTTNETNINSNNNETVVNVEMLKTSEEKRQNMDPISNGEIASYTGTTDIWTNISQSILDAAGVDKDGNKIEGKGVTFHEGGQCQVYVRMVYAEAGLGEVSRGSALGAAKQTLVSKSMSIIPIGAAVYGTSSTSNGHVGIYIGHGKVIHNVGSIKIQDLKSWAERYHYVGWGWQSGEEKLTSSSSTSGVSLTGLGNSTCSAIAGSIEGNGPEQTVCLTLKNAGFSVNAIAAIMGNIDAESSWNPTSENEKGATGLIQWMGDRLNLLKSRYPDNWQEPKSQAEYILYELNNNESKTMKYIQTHQDSDVNSLTEGFCNEYERPGPDHCSARKEKGSKYVSYVQNNCGGASTNGQNTESKDGITYINGVMIVNKTYPLPSNYVPSGTHEKAEATGKCNGCIKNEAWTAYQKLREAGIAAGVPSSQLDIVSGYRSYAYQDYIYNRYVKQKGKVEADRASARPGYSEHQTGLAMDLGDASASYHGTKGAKFIHDNAYKYGFILRYPNGKEKNTGYKYESWHIRYVGVDLATKLYNNGDWISLEEYFNITSRYSN